MKSESKSTGQTHLPKSLHQFFWDYQPGELSWETDRDLIARRILTSGSWIAIIWLRKKMGDEALRQWLLDHRGRGLSPRQIRFWELLLDLPKKQTDNWIHLARSMPWGQR